MSDWEFIFDGVFGFLSSPIWMVPIISFIEEQSVVFKESEENFLEWTEIHKRYGGLVESLLSSYLKDVGITDDQFMQACKTPGVQERPQMQAVFEQLWAAEDFEIFKRMMIQKNVELELQALEIVRKRQGKVAKKKAKPKQRIIKTEEEILAEVIKQSEKEYEEHKKRLENDAKSEAKFDAAMEKVLSESNKHFERLENEVLEKQEATLQCVEESIKQSNEAEKKQESPKATSPAPTVQRTSSKSPETFKEKTPSPTQEPVKSKSQELKPLKAKTPLKPIQKSAGASAADDWIKSAQEENESSSSSSIENKVASMSEEDMARRMEYLKQQRDRLLALKKAEREKQLQQYEKSEPKKRPTSARVARQAVSGEPIQAPEISAEDAKRIAMRKALAEKLKKEVIHK